MDEVKALRLAAAVFRPNRAPLVLVCLAGVWLRVADLNDVAVRSPDETTYTSQARVWLRSGTAGMRTLVSDYDHRPELRDFPPPTRAGVIRLAAWMFRLTGKDDPGAGALAACAASILSLAIVALMAVRFLPPWAALCALVFYAASPVELVIARRLWPDVLCELPAVVALWSACAIAAGSRRRVWFLLLAAAGAAGLTVRETFPIPYGFTLLWPLWELAVKRRDRRSAALLLGLCLAALAGSVVWLGGAVGSLADYIRLSRHGPTVAAANDYVRQFTSGPPWLLLEGFWIVSPMATVCAAGGFLAAFAARREKPHGRLVAGIAAVTAGAMAVMMSDPHYLSLRFYSVVMGPLALLAGYGLWYAGRLAGKWLLPEDRTWMTVAAAVILLAVTTADYFRFERIFVRDSLGDTAVRSIQFEQNP